MSNLNLSLTLVDVKLVLHSIRLFNTKLDIIFLVFLLLEVHQPIRGRWQTVQCSTGTAVRADAGSYFLKGISSRGQIATDNCQFLRLKRRRSSEENQRSEEGRESA